MGKKEKVLLARLKKRKENYETEEEILQKCVDNSCQGPKQRHREARLNKLREELMPKLGEDLKRVVDIGLK